MGDEVAEWLKGQENFPERTAKQTSQSAIPQVKKEVVKIPMLLRKPIHRNEDYCKKELEIIKRQFSSV